MTDPRETEPGGPEVDERADRLAALEADNARLRRLLDSAGAPEGLRHGLRDTVALLRAVVRRSAESSGDVATYVAHLEGRLDAVMRMRARLDAFGEADLHTLIADELLVHLVREGERATLSGPGIRLRAKAAQVVALAVHELASNAVEHGPLTQADGTVAVDWRVEPDPAGPNADPILTLTWKETGGAPAAPPEARGFGTVVLEDMLAYDLKARAALTYEPDGLRYTAAIPLAAQVGRPAEDAPG